MIKDVKMRDYEFKTDPFDHQDEAFMLSREEIVFAYLMEMGTGKTKVTIDVGAWLFMQGKVNFWVVSAPKGVHSDWARKEIPLHLPDWVERRVCIWSSDMKKAEWDNFHSLFDPEFKGLRILCVNHDAFSAAERHWKTVRVIAKKVRKDRPRWGSAITMILNTFDVMFVVDESSKIKTPGARRSQRHANLGKKAAYKRILTGTLGGPMEAYMQFQFLDPEILCGSPPMNFYAFKHHFANWVRERNHQQNRSYEVLTGYKNLDELQNKINGSSFRVLKKDCLDLPDKVYKRRQVTLAEGQRKIYDKLKQTSILELRGEDTTVANVLVKYLRLQQVIGGWLPNPDNPHGPAEPMFEDPATNPRIAMMMEVIEQNRDQRVIIWSRFRQEIEAIKMILNKEYGEDKAVDYYGATTVEEREENVYRFQGSRPIIDPDTHQKIGEDVCPEEDRAQFMVSQQHAGGYGNTWTAATCVIYYSNDFSLEARLQSEDRCHRIGQTNKVLYVDLEAAMTLDTRILKALLNKKELADLVVGDDPAEWF